MSNRFAILRIKKHKNLGSVYHVARHHTRESVCKTADPARLHLNKSNGPATARGVVDAIQARIDDAQTRAKRKFRTDSVKCVEFMITASPDWWKTASPKARAGYLNDAAKWLRGKFGAINVIGLYAHQDEHSPHLHALCVPLAGDVLNAKHYLGGAKKLSELQTEFAEKVGKPYGLERGIKRSGAIHTPVAEFWAAMDAPAPTPSKADYAAAALGFKPEAIKVQETQNKTLQFARKQSAQLQRNAAKVQAQARKNELDGIRLEAVENFAREGNSAVLEAIEARKTMQAQAAEIERLRAENTRLRAPQTPTPTNTMRTPTL